MLAASIDVEPAHKAAVTTTFMQVARIWHLSVCAKQVEVALDYDRKKCHRLPTLGQMRCFPATHLSGALLHHAILAP